MVFANSLEWSEGLHKIAQSTKFNNEDFFSDIIFHADVSHAGKTGLSSSAATAGPEFERISSYTLSVLAHI